LDEASAALASTKPYLLRAIYEWCVDQRFTPYLLVVVDARTQVPRPHVRDGQIVLNIGPEAAHQLHMGNDFITFAARFGGVAHNLSIPVDQVAAIYARENGQGMAFETSGGAEAPIEAPAAESEAGGTGEERQPAPPEGEPAKGGGARPHLVRIK
jgi:stringent starvation protein B